MLQYESEQLSFNLLALCQSPLGELRRELVVNIRSLALLWEHMKNMPNWELSGGGDDDVLRELSESSLADYGLSKKDIDALGDEDKLDRLRNKLSTASLDGREVLDLRHNLEDEQRRIRSEYATEVASTDEDTIKAASRRKDHTLAIHEWVKKLAQHGVLHGLHEEAQNPNEGLINA